MNAARRFPLRLTKICALLFSTSIAFSGQESQLDDKHQILRLLKSLSDHSARAEDLLDPKLPGEKRGNDLRFFRDPSYELTFIPTGEPEIGRDGRAIVPARVHFKDPTSELDATVDVRFVQREGQWYFADFGFLGWPLSLVVLFIVGMTIAFSFATGVLILRSRLQKQNRLNGANRVKIFVPIFWPKLFSESRDWPAGSTT